MKDAFVFAKDLTKKDARFHIELELDPEELQAIGHVCAQWAFLEFHIFKYTKFLSEEVLGIPLPKEAENDSFRRRKKVWEELTKLAFKDHPEIISRVQALIFRAGSLQGQRHKVIHGLIQWDDEDKERVKIYTRKNPGQTPWKVDAQRIEELALEIATLNSDFLNCHNENPDLPLPVLGISPSPRRPGTPIPADIPRDLSSRLQAIPEARKSPKR